jgi:CheY-like chemotaxis protein
MIRCFLIDDDLDDQELFLIALKDVNESIECIIANDGPEALEILQTLDSDIPHCIFIDMNMPKMNGVACLKEVKNLKHVASADVFMFSTTSDPRLMDICMELGAREFIVKPAGLSALCATLANILEPKIKLRLDEP